MNKQTVVSLVIILLMTALLRGQTSAPMGVYKGFNLWAVEVGDFNQDGLPDGMFLTASDLHVELNHGVGNLPWPLTFPGEGGTQLKPLDLDGDGDLDFLVLKSADYALNTAVVSVVINNSSVLTSTLVTVGGRVLPQLCDVDNDGLLDLLGDRTWNRGTAPGVFAAARQALAFASVPAPAGTLVAEPATYYPGDFDGDGDVDLINYRRTSGTTAGAVASVDLHVNDGSGLFGYRMSIAVAFPSFQIPSGQLRVHDVNRDGVDDFIVEEQGHGQIAIHLGDVTGHFLTGRSAIPGLGHFETLADLDGDGDLDLIVRRPALSTPFPPTGAPPSLNVIENVGHDIFVEPASSTLPFVGYNLRAVDFDLDGRDDLIYPGAFGGLGYGVAIGTMTSTLGPPIRDIVGLLGIGQSVASPAPFPLPLTFIVLDEFGVGVPGYAVTIAAEDELVTPTSAVTDAAGFVNIPVTSGGRVGVGRVKISGPNAASRYFAFEVTASRVIQPISGFTQGGNIGGNFPEPLRLRIEDLLGNPITGASVAIDRSYGTTSAPIAGSTYITDANGEIAVAISTGVGQSPGAPNNGFGDLGDLGITIRSPGAQATTASLFTRRLFQTYMANTSGFWDRRVRYHHENVWVPLLLMADVPQPAPVATVFGPLHTSLLSPSPTLFLLDGIGLTGPPLPGLITTQQGAHTGYVFELVFAWNLLPAGTKVVFQVMTYDNAYAFPTKVGLSEPVTVTF